MSSAKVPCKFCGAPGLAGTQQCDGCWELSGRLLSVSRGVLRSMIEASPVIAKTVAAATGSVPAERAYWEGWCEAADWASRDDLYADRDSDAYANAMRRRLSAAVKK